MSDTPEKLEKLKRLTAIRELQTDLNFLTRDTQHFAEQFGKEAVAELEKIASDLEKVVMRLVEEL